MLYLICSHKHKDVNKELLFFMGTLLYAATVSQDEVT